MNILAVDERRSALDQLTVELTKVFPGDEIKSATDPLEALEWAKQIAEQGKRLDYIFTEIPMEAISGLDLACKVKEIHPRVHVFFCTSHKDYAFDATQIFAKGYLLKPVKAEAIRRTMEEMLCGRCLIDEYADKKLQVKTFGHFEVFANGCSLVFKREKAKELFAYLVDRHGSSVTTEQIAAVLWEDKPYGRSVKNFVSNVFLSMKATLAQVGAEDVLVKSRNHLAIDPRKIQCDAYDYELGDAFAINAFHGEYMANYSWAEFAVGKFVQKI